jgi:hypothetical protein
VAPFHIQGLTRYALGTESSVTKITFKIFLYAAIQAMMGEGNYALCFSLTSDIVLITKNSTKSTSYLDAVSLGR